MIRFIYNLFWPIGLLFFMPGYLAKMIRRGGYREKFGQRLGFYDGELRVRPSKQRSTWLHAVSVGEVNVALKLANALRMLDPDLRCVLTTTTTTGFALAFWLRPRFGPISPLKRTHVAFRLRWSTRDCPRTLSEDIGSFDFLSRRPSGFWTWFAYQKRKMPIAGPRSVFRAIESV